MVAGRKRGTPAAVTFGGSTARVRRTTLRISLRAILGKSCLLGQQEFEE
jgi:hypothetical protein